MSDADAGFDDWRQVLAETVDFAHSAGCQPAIVQTLAAMLGEPRREEWHDNGAHWLHVGSDAPWNQAARDATAAVPPADLVKCIQLSFAMHLRFEQMHHSRLDLPLFKRA